MSAKTDCVWHKILGLKVLRLELQILQFADDKGVLAPQGLELSENVGEVFQVLNVETEELYNKTNL